MESQVVTRYRHQLASGELSSHIFYWLTHIPWVHSISNVNTMNQYKRQRSNVHMKNRVQGFQIPNITCSIDSPLRTASTDIKVKP